MTFECVRSYLELGYFISQITLAFIALFAAIFAANQLKSFKTYELLKYIESKDSREARLIVMRHIQPVMHTNWWSHDENGSLQKAASDVAAIYDVVNIMLSKESPGLKKLFYENWAHSIVKSHSILKSYLDFRRKDPSSPRAYNGFSELAATVEPYTKLNDKQ